MKQLLLTSAIFFLFSSCKQHSNAQPTVSLFADTPAAVIVKPGLVDEASGIADSRANRGLLWVEQDSGNPPELSLLNYDGALVKKIPIKGAKNRDWEDMAVAKGPEKEQYYIYMADIGDNFLQYNHYYIYRFKEPTVSVDSITSFETITFTYPDGSNNAEAILVDDETRDIYIITKSSVRSNIYKLLYPQPTDTVTAATLVGSLPFTIITGAAISPDGSEIIVKTYTTLNYWKRMPGETIEQALKKPTTSLKYQTEIQGEALGFKNDNSGFFTLSEKPPMVGSVNLNFYKRH